MSCRAEWSADWRYFYAGFVIATVTYTFVMTLLIIDAHSKLIQRYELNASSMVKVKEGQI